MGEIPDSGVPAFRKAISLSPMRAGVTLSQELRDIAVGVILEADADLAGKAQDSAADIVFTAADGITLVPHEIESFDPATGALVAWVKVPVLSAAGDTTLFMYYGVADAVDRQNAAETWAVGYASVWHMVARDVDGSTNEYRDSAALQNHGAATGNARPVQVADGIVGPGQLYDGSNGSNADLVVVPDPPDGSLDFGTSSFSWSVWVHVTQSAGGFDIPWFKGASADTGQPGYDFELGTGRWVVRVSDGVRFGEIELGNEPDFLGQDVFLVGVIDRTAQAFRAFVNGVAVDIVRDTTPLLSVDNDFEARIGGEALPFKGVLDEVRVYPVALSADQAAIEHANVARATDFLSVGGEQPTSYPQ